MRGARWHERGVAGECQLRGQGRAALPRRRTRSSASLPFLLESALDVESGLKKPNAADEKFEDVVKSVEKSPVLVLVC
jgi:hypothetical protein